MVSASSAVTSSTPMASAKILAGLAGHRITAMTRYSWWPAEEAATRVNVASHDVFSLTSGPLEVRFDTGIAIGLASDPSLNSVIVWVERDESGRLLCPEPMSEDKELHAIAVDNPKYANNIWRSAIGVRIARVIVLKRRAASARMVGLPSEVGLCLVLENGLRILAAHGLHNDSDDFVVIREEMISPNIRADLTEVAVE